MEELQQVVLKEDGSESQEVPHSYAIFEILNQSIFSLEQ